MNFCELCIKDSVTLRAALCRLEQTGKRILFVLNDTLLLGTLMDSDIRRHLLSGGTLEDPAAAAAQRHPITAKNRDTALELLQQNSSPLGLPAIPVVGINGDLLDIVLPSNSGKIQYPQLGIPVVITAGGRGTRLEPYTKILPKPLIPVGELPIIEHIMRQFLKYGCSEFHIIVNYKKELLKAYFAENECHYQTIWYDEAHPLGTGGGLSLLKGHLHGTFFFTNCDILLQSDYNDMLHFHRKNGNSITMVGAQKNLTIPYGIVEAGEHGIVQGFREKPELSFLTNAGMYIVESEVLDNIPENTAMGFPDIIEAQRQKGHRVAVYPVDGEEWLDMGQLDELERMREHLYGG